ncbi:hypothetical protein GCM10027194_29650 [Thalassiella azotivora]
MVTLGYVAGAPFWWSARQHDAEVDRLVDDVESGLPDDVEWAGWDGRAHGWVGAGDVKGGCEVSAQLTVVSSLSRDGLERAFRERDLDAQVSVYEGDRFDDGLGAPSFADGSAEFVVVVVRGVDRLLDLRCEW